MTETSLPAMAKVALRAGQLTRAHALLMATTVLQPDDSEAWLLLGWTTPDPAMARDCFLRALALDPSNVLAADGLAWAKEQSGAPDVARQIARTRQAMSVDPPANHSTGLWRISGVEPLGGHIWRSKPAKASTPAQDMALAKLQYSRKEPDADKQEDKPSVSAPTRVDAAPVSARRDRFNRSLSLSLVYLAALSLAEIITTHVEPRVGLVLYGLLLFALPLSAILAPRGPLQKLPVTLALVPLIRLLSLSLPFSNVPFVYWYVIVGAPLFLAGFLVARSLGFSRARVGLTISITPWQLLIGLSGAAVGYLEYLILRPAPLISAPNWEQFWLPAVILFVFTGFLEEFLFRGLMQRVALESLGRIGAVYVAVLFAVLHVGYHSLVDVVFVFAVGLYFGLVVARTGSILGVTLAHGLANIGLFLVFPFLF